MPFSVDETLAERYQLSARLGHEGSTQAFQAKDQTTGKTVFLKLLPMASLESWKHHELFEREARVLSQLKHPGIPLLRDFFQLEGPTAPCGCLVMDWIPGQSLQQRLESGWRPSETEVRALAASLLEILAYLHALHPPVVHRDLKPSNLIWGEEGRIYLVDFGAVQAALQPQGGSTVVGTYGYMAPEQFAGRALPASDLYGLGATLVHLVTGLAPQEMAMEDLEIKFEPHYEGNPAFKNWLRRLLAPSLKQRFDGAETALKALQQLSSQARSEHYRALPSDKRHLETFIAPVDRLSHQLSPYFPAIQREENGLSLVFGVPQVPTSQQWLQGGMTATSLMGGLASGSYFFNALANASFQAAGLGLSLFFLLTLSLGLKNLWESHHHYTLQLNKEGGEIMTYLGKWRLWKRRFAHTAASVSILPGAIRLNLEQPYLQNARYQLGGGFSEEEAASLRAEIDLYLIPNPTGGGVYQSAREVRQRWGV